MFAFPNMGMVYNITEYFYAFSVAVLSRIWYYENKKRASLKKLFRHTLCGRKNRRFESNFYLNSQCNFRGVSNFRSTKISRSNV